MNYDQVMDNVFAMPKGGTERFNYLTDELLAMPEELRRTQEGRLLILEVICCAPSEMFEGFVSDIVDRLPKVAEEIRKIRAEHFE